MMHRDPYVKYIDADIDHCVRFAREYLAEVRGTNMVKIPARNIVTAVIGKRAQAGMVEVSSSMLSLTLTHLRLVGEIKPLGVREGAKQIAWGNTTVEVRRAVSAEGEAVVPALPEDQARAIAQAFLEGRRQGIADAQSALSFLG